MFRSSVLIITIYLTIYIQCLAFAPRILNTAFNSNANRHTTPTIVLHETINNNVINMIDILSKQTGNKKLLQELSQNLFNGTSPSYNWKKNGSLIIRITNVVEMDFDSIRGDNLSILEKKQMELEGAREVIEWLLDNSKYNSYITNWIAKRTNRDNVPRILRSLDVQTAVMNRSLAIVVDAENVPDFRKYFYTDINGDIKFSTPLLPQLKEAPRLQAPSIKMDDFGSKEETNENDILPYSLYSDSDTCILAYAHTKSSQSAWANRRTTDSRKDAADAMILFDLGSLQHCPSLQHILLVTGDGFGSSAAACFDSFSTRRPGSVMFDVDSYRKYEMDSESSQYTSNNVLMKVLPVGRYKWMNEAPDKYGQPIFKWASTCSEAARLLGRLSF